MLFFYGGGRFFPPAGRERERECVCERLRRNILLYPYSSSSLLQGDKRKGTRETAKKRGEKARGRQDPWPIKQLLAPVQLWVFQAKVNPSVAEFPLDENITFWSFSSQLPLPAI